MDRYFPADVSLRVSGELADAQQLFPQARQLLSRATRMIDAGAPLAKLFLPGTDGSLIYCYLHGPIKQLYVQPAPPVAPPIEGVVTPPQLEEPTIVNLEMLNGVVHPGTLVSGALHEFHPTQICAEIYQLTYDWQDVERLAVAPDPAISSAETQARFPKPSNYSGAMKRVVQAIYGLGVINPEVNDWVGELEYATQNRYDFHWNRTDGILQVGTVFWLIRISEVDGVLAMPLPLFAGTTTDDFASALEVLGDTETYSIVQEFGGLPNGETFPTDAALEEALLAGDVLRLMTPEAIAVFYVEPAILFGRGPVNKTGLWSECGWAFSDKGTTLEAHNTSFWYNNYGAATRWDYQNTKYELLEADSNPDRTPQTVWPMEDRCMRAEHWKISFTITNATALTPARGSAALVLAESGLFSGSQKIRNLSMQNAFPWWSANNELLRVPSGDNTDALINFDHWGSPPNYPPEAVAAYKQLDCPVLVFYVGEVLEIVRHQRERTYTHHLIALFVDYTDSIGSGYDWQYFNPDNGSTNYESHSAFDCSGGGDWSPLPGAWESTELGQHGFASPYATYIDSAHMTVLTYDVSNGGPVNLCATDLADVVLNVLIYEVRLTYNEGPDYGYGDAYGIWAIPWHYTYHHYTTTTDIGAGSNTSLGTVTEDDSAANAIFDSPVLMTWRPSAMKAADIEGLLYDANHQIGPITYTATTAFFTGYTRNYDVTWKRTGSFYSARLDLRRNQEYSDNVQFGATMVVFTKHGDYWESSVGLVIPGLVREGYGFIRWNGGYKKTYNNLGHGIGNEAFPEKLEQHFYFPALGTGTIAGPVLDPFESDKWQKTINAFSFKFSASVNAGPTKCGVVQNGIYADIVFPGLSNETMTPPQSFLGTANGIDVTDFTARDTTYVGAV